MIPGNNDSLNEDFQTLCEINELVYTEQARDFFLTRICRIYVNHRYCDYAAIALLDPAGKLESITTADTGTYRPDPLSQAPPFICFTDFNVNLKTTIIPNREETCHHCPLFGGIENRITLRIPLIADQRIYGIQCISFFKETAGQKAVIRFFETSARLVAFKLHELELSEQNAVYRKRIDQTDHLLMERIKELECLYAISEIVDEPQNTLDDIARNIVEILPAALQQPDIASARLRLEDRTFQTDNFKSTRYALKADVDLDGRSIGYLEVCYLAPTTGQNGVLFLPEENLLLKSVAERLGKIIQRLEAEDQIQKRVRQFRQLVENSLTGISIIRNDRVVYQNSEQERLFGPLPRKTIFTDIENIHAEDVVKVRAFYEKLRNAVTEPLDIDFRFYPPGKKDSGIGMQWVYCRVSSVRYKHEDAMLVNIMDLTKPKELEHLLRIQDKMSSLGRVAAGIAHEIRNPLSGINIYINTLEKIFQRQGSDAKVEKILHQLKSASCKIEAVIKRVMDFSKPSEPRMVKADINLPVEAAIELSSATLRKSSINLEKRLDRNLPHCLVDPHLIEEVILNLINNATEALKNKTAEKTIRITSGCRKNFVRVCISDSGPGINEDLREKIFDPFYTTKTGSTGIGLNISNRIVEDHDGKLSISHSRLGGAQFIIEIPAAD